MRTPVHVTLKIAEGLPSLRSKAVFRILRRAVARARAQNLRVIHFALLSKHLHLIVEPTSDQLAAEFQSFGISFAKGLNALLKRKGKVFQGRYHLQILQTPTQVACAVRYVLTNEAKHQGRQEIKLGPFSSALAFTRWKSLFRQKPTFVLSGCSEPMISTWYREILSPPRTWLLKSGIYGSVRA